MEAEWTRGATTCGIAWKIPGKGCEALSKHVEIGSPKFTICKKLFFFFKLGGLVGTQRKKAEHAMFENHFERRASSTKRVHNARTKTCAEDHATLF